jgi:hypothetical protein
VEKISLKRTDQRTLSFSGELLWEDETSPDSAHPNYSGSPGRWTVARLYQTAKGKYVLQVIQYTAWQGERDIHEALVFNAPEEVVDWAEQNLPGWAEDLAEVLEVEEEVE